METRLRLLMRDGALYLTFRPCLTVEQYAELFEHVNAATTKAELRHEMDKLSEKWKGQLAMDSVLDPSIEETRRAS